MYASKVTIEELWQMHSQLLVKTEQVLDNAHLISFVIRQRSRQTMQLREHDLSPEDVALKSAGPDCQVSHDPQVVTGHGSAHVSSRKLQVQSERDLTHLQYPCGSCLQVSRV